MFPQGGGGRRRRGGLRGGMYLHTNNSIPRWETSNVLLVKLQPTCAKAILQFACRFVTNAMSIVLGVGKAQYSPSSPSPTQRLLRFFFFFWCCYCWKKAVSSYFFCCCCHKGKKKKKHCHPQSSVVPKGTTSIAETFPTFLCNLPLTLHPALFVVQHSRLS